jgi:protein-L-isoaspartate(D-aspartate) O-methyltransferase
MGAGMAFWSNHFRDFINSESSESPHEGDPFALARRRMVEEQFIRRDIVDPRVLEVMGRVARERFVDASLRDQAYEDHPLPIGLGQTISQPYIVALMTQLARTTSNCRALEVGVGSGYQTAVLAELCLEVFGVEIHKPLAEDARERLAALGYKNVSVFHGDGFHGLSEHAPFDVILVTAAPDQVPPPLIEQLTPGGRLVIPVGKYHQELMLLEKRADGSIDRKSLIPVHFVPLTRESGESRVES